MVTQKKAKSLVLSCLCIFCEHVVQNTQSLYVCGDSVSFKTTVCNNIYNTKCECACVCAVQKVYL